jgi:uncharacterized coiled-coil protein SlyX
MSNEQSEGMDALNQSLNDHMEICALKRKVKSLEAKVKRLTKAGDAMFFIMEKPPHKKGGNYPMLSWLAAKKGWSSK